MPLTCPGTSRHGPHAAYPSMGMTPDIGPPQEPNVQNMPPLPWRDVLPDEEDGPELDLPIEDEPDTGTDGSDQPEKHPGGGAPWEDIKRKKDEMEEDIPPRPEKQRKPDVDEELPEPETERKPDTPLQ
jgi:hypothetical protein